MNTHAYSHTRSPLFGSFSSCSSCLIKLMVASWSHALLQQTSWLSSFLLILRTWVWASTPSCLSCFIFTCCNSEVLCISIEDVGRQTAHENGVEGMSIGSEVDSQPSHEMPGLWGPHGLPWAASPVMLSKQLNDKCGDYTWNAQVLLQCLVISSLEVNFSSLFLQDHHLLKTALLTCGSGWVRISGVLAGLGQSDWLTDSSGSTSAKECLSPLGNTCCVQDLLCPH